MLNLVGFIVKG